MLHLTVRRRNSSSACNIANSCGFKYFFAVTGCIYYFVAARTALHSFIQSRETTAREKDLLKSVKVSYIVTVTHCS
jgi:hypothetical protein